MSTERGDRESPASRTRCGLVWRSRANAARQLIVLGMHRSGTSATAGALARMGVYVGDEEELTPKSWENPTGFFERRDARKICDTLLHESGADWWKISAFNADNANHETVRSQRSAIRDLIQRLDEHGTWAVKEPRLCLLLPIFQAALNNPIAIVAFRHPVEVARSLRRRNGFPIQAGLALWEAYVVSLLRVSSGMDRVFVDYQALTLDPPSVLNALATDLRTRGVVGLDVNAAIASIQPSLRRERYDETADSDLLTPPQRKLWKDLMRSYAWKRAPALSASGLAVLQEFESDETSRQQARASIKTLSSKIASLQTLEASGKAAAENGAAGASDATRRLNELGEQAEELKRELQLQTTANEVLKTELEQLRATVAVQSQERADNQLEIGVLRARLDMATQQAEDLRRELSASESQAAERQVARDVLQLRYAEQCERAAEDARRIEDAHRELSAREAELAQRQTELGLLQQRYSQQAERGADEARRLQELQDALAARDALNSELRAALEASKSDQATLRRELSALSAEIRALRDRFAEQEERLRAEGRSVEAISAALSARDAEHAELRRRLQDSQDDRSKLAAELAERDTVLAALQTVLEGSREEHVRTRVELSSAHSDLTAANARNTKQEDRLAIERRLVEELRSSLSVQEVVASKLRVALESAESDNASLRDTVSLKSSAATELQHRHARTSDQLKRATDELKAEREKRMALTAQSARQRDRVRLLREKAQRQHARVRALQAEAGGAFRQKRSNRNATRHDRVVDRLASRFERRAHCSAISVQEANRERSSDGRSGSRERRAGGRGFHQAHC